MLAIAVGLVGCGGSEPAPRRDSGIPDSAVDGVGVSLDAPVRLDGAIPDGAAPDRFVFPDMRIDQAKPDTSASPDLPAERPSVDVAIQVDSPPLDTAPAVDAGIDAPVLPDSGTDAIDAPAVDAPLALDGGGDAMGDGGGSVDSIPLNTLAIAGTWHASKNLGPGPHVLILSETTMIERTDNDSLEVLFTIDSYDNEQQHLQVTATQFLKGAAPYPLGTVFKCSYRLFDGGQKMDFYYGTTGYLTPQGGIEGNEYLSYAKVP